MAEAPPWSGLRRVLAVVAHPDDESFGLGAVLAAMAADGVEVDVLVATRGEASTLGASSSLGEVRHAEAEAAAGVLGVRRLTVADLPDGGLSAVPADELAALVVAHLDEADALVAFDTTGITGHPDHIAASAAAVGVAADRGLAVLEWGLHPSVAAVLSVRFDMAVGSMADGPGVLDVAVDRSVQQQAIACHASQVEGNAFLTARLAAAGGWERVRVTSPRR